MKSYQAYCPYKLLFVNNKAKVLSHEVCVQDLQEHDLHKSEFDQAFWLLAVCCDLHPTICHQHNILDKWLEWSHALTAHDTGLWERYHQVHPATMTGARSI